MPRFAHIFEAAADTLNAYYQAVAEVIGYVMRLNKSMAR